MKGVIVFDLEGPLSPMDLAFELMGLREGGDKVFAVISRYDDLLTLEGKAGYEPGDTLRLIVPFLIYWRITEREILEVSQRATLMDGSKELIEVLRKEGWEVYIVSTSYEQHARAIARRLGIRGKLWFNGKNVFFTKFPLDRFQKRLKSEDFSLVERYIKFILDHLYIEDLTSGKMDKEIRSVINLFFWFLPDKLNEIVKEVEPMGGERKVRALDIICRWEKIERKGLVVVGDSITDFKMLKAVKETKGLAIAFNANEYVLPYATFAVASLNLRDIKPVLDAWEKREAGRIEKLKNLVTRKGPPYYQWIGDKDLARLKEDLKYHQECRQIARGKAAKLG